MLVKCQICGKKIDREDAYRVEHVTKSGSKSNKYYCNEEEYENDRKEKEYYKECQYLLDQLFQEVIVDNTRNKKLSELHKAGYSYETIYTCISDISKTIENALVIKRDDFKGKNAMYMKLAYVFGIIKKEITKYEHKDKSKTMNASYLKPEEIAKSKRKVKQEKRSLMDIIKQKGENNG